MARGRLRDLGIAIGPLPTGPHNAITDVPGVLVGHTTIIADTPRVARTGVTLILPREGAIWRDHAPAGRFTFNGFGEMTGIHWIDEVGLLSAPIALTNSYSVGTVSDALFAYADAHGHGEGAVPLVAETWDGLLNDLAAFHVTAQHVEAAIASATGGPLAEGNVGGGTGMICHQFKGGIGTASRLIQLHDQTYTVGALVQANYGWRDQLRIDGVPVGRELGAAHTPLPCAPTGDGGSIIIIVATDAPLLPIQCQRLARRATVGLARVGGVGNNSSGDIFLAFSTGNHAPVGATAPIAMHMLPNRLIDPLFSAVADSVEEAIINALTAAETMTGLAGCTVHALPLDELARVMARYRPH